MKAFSRTSRHIVGIPLFFLLVFSFALSGHSGATGIVKERMDLMKKMGDSNKVIGDMVKRKRPFDFGEIRALAVSMQQHAARIPELFPETKDSREGHATEAKPVIWDQWENFESLSNDLQRESAKLSDIAAEGDEKAIRTQYAAVAKTCRGCHKDYRRPKEE